jgi:hypothetical protein
MSKQDLDLAKKIRQIEKAAAKVRGKARHEVPFHMDADTDYRAVPDWEDELDLIQRAQFKELLSFGVGTNMALNKIVGDYINILHQNPELQKEHGWDIIGLFSGANFIEAFTTMGEGYECSALIKYQDIHLMISIRKYLDQNRYVYTLSAESNCLTDITGHFIYLKLLKHAMAFSDLKGSYFTMPTGRFEWEKKVLEKRDFSDIFLPQSTIDDLKLYVGIYENKGKLMRYLFAGNPGTGKTESTLTIANTLKKLNVTIIKSAVDELLKEKIELAEMLSPAIIVFDDIDLSLGSRSTGGFSSNLHLFLDCLDGTEKIKSNVGIIATTNSIDLLDLAAQRPGRFDKILSFDSITEENIKDIIFKSLKVNFKLSNKSKEAKLFTSDLVIKTFHDSKVTGSHIYHSIKMLKERIDFLDKTDVTVDWIVSEFEKDIKSLDDIRNKAQLSDKLPVQRRKMGFGLND